MNATQIHTVRCSPRSWNEPSDVRRSNPAAVALLHLGTWKLVPCRGRRQGRPGPSSLSVRHHVFDDSRSASISRRSSRTSSRINRVCSSPSSLRSSVTCDCIALTTTAMNRFNTMNVAMSR